MSKMSIHSPLAASTLVSSVFALPLLFATVAAHGKPDAPTVSNSKITNSGQFSGMTAKGKQGTSSGGGFQLGYGKLGIDASGSHSTAGTTALIEAGTTTIVGAASVKNSTITNQAKAANVKADGAQVRVGAVQIGR